jgi:hypothetical protein
MLKTQCLCVFEYVSPKERGERRYMDEEVVAGQLGAEKMPNETCLCISGCIPSEGALNVVSGGNLEAGVD